MLAANEAVAQSFHERNEDTLWRIHDAPDRDAAGGVRRPRGALRASRSTSTWRARPKGLKQVLDQLKGQPAEQRAVVPAAALAQAGDLRRRAIWATSGWRRPTTCTSRRRSAAIPIWSCTGCSSPVCARDGSRRAASSRRRSRRCRTGPRCRRWRRIRRSRSARAMEAEREVVDLYRAFFMRDRIGDVFDGVISAVAGFGVFVASTIRSSRGWSASRRWPTTTTSTTRRPAGWWAGDRAARSPWATASGSRCSRSAWCAARWTSRWPGTARATTTTAAIASAARGRRHEKAGRRDKRGRRDEKPDRARQDRADWPRAVRTNGALTSRSEVSQAAIVPEATGGAPSRRSADDDHSRAAGRGRGARALAVRPAQPRQQGAGAARAARSGPPDLSARSRSDHPFEGFPAARRQDAGVPGSGGRPLPDAHHPHAGGRADRAHGDAGAAPQRIADRSDRDGPRPRPHAVRPRGREGARQADAGRVPPRQAVAARRRDAGARRRRG